MECCYEPLNSATEPTAIRIFHLEPAKTEGARIVGRLVHGSYASSRYTAVSYVWGDPTPKYQITINGQSFLVASNVFQVLKWLRKSNKIFALWVDALCINQSDITERNVQVQGMAKVYGSAFEVIACLGYKTPDFDLGYSFLKKLSLVSLDQAIDETNDPNNAPAFEAVLSLLDKRYWSRLWILQEISVNKRVRLRFEQDTRSELGVDDLIRFFKICNGANRRGPKATLHGVSLWRLSWVSDRVSPIAIAASLFPLTAGELQPLLYMHVCGGPIATDPLDYVYGLFGLFLEGLFSVDYALSPKQLYLKVIRVEQEHTGDLDFLSYAWGNYAEESRTGFENKLQLPRWAVDFSHRTLGLVPNSLTVSRNCRFFVKTVYCTSGDRKQKVEFAQECSDYFKACGVVASTLEIVGSIHDASSSNLIWPQDWIALGGLRTLAAPRRSQPARAAIQPNFQAWSAGKTSACFKELNIWWRTLFCDSLYARERLDDSQEYRELVPPTSVEAVEKLCRFLTRGLDVTMHDGRRMFKTADGRLGLAPSYARVGDCVCVLFGGDVPYVLRKRVDLDYEFVGECYLQDAMDGQELSKGHPEQRFTIYG